ncbi:MAG: DUF397 domain-containing protein [Micromonosporaceae bacterium]|nr:DUF397 domain-containing protein [Micromonosporaceae bacterium]
MAESDPLRATWRKSSRSSNQQSCVEVAMTDGSVLLRDSQDRLGPVLGVPSEDWSAFLAALRDGAFDLPAF